MSSSVKQTARDVESSPLLRAFARGGYAANGVVHVLIGVIVLAVAFGGNGETDQTGAFRAIAEAPLGFVGLWILAVLLWALAIYHALEGVLVVAETSAKTWGRRVSEWGQAVVFAALGVLAASVALGARNDGDQSTKQASSTVLSMPGGVFLLGAVGLGVGIGGIAFIVMGIMRSFEKKMSIPSSSVGTAVKGLGVFGYIAKGVALGVVGVLLVVAAVKVDPDAAGGLDAAIRALLALPAGPWLAGVVGVGLIAYGVFCGLRAKYAKL